MTFRLHPFVDFLNRSAGIRRLLAVLNDLDKPVRVLRSGGHQPARAMVFEAAPDQFHIIGDQRRGQRIALEPRQIAPVKAKPDRRFAVN